ncbi:MAG: large conductance mechanosensitive channel protein MscL [Lachnospiraceae bacterium]|nr:large conductance mechanosensitive channel protein MscL [Lachnospiraceae bacterium]
MKKFWNEFKEFAFQGNMMDLAVGMIIGSAFTAIVSALVDDLINPVIGIFTQGIDFSNLFVSLNGQHYDSLDAAEAAGAAVFKYGSFISAVIIFIITALVVFILVKVLSTMSKGMKKQEEEEEAPTTKTCPYCQSEISILATRCPNCTSQLPVEEEEQTPAAEPEPAPAE